MIHFSNCGENQVNGYYTRTKKLKLQYKATATEVAIQAGTFCKPDSGIHSAAFFVVTCFFRRDYQPLLRKGDERTAGRT